MLIVQATGDPQRLKHRLETSSFLRKPAPDQSLDASHLLVFTREKLKGWSLFPHPPRLNVEAQCSAQSYLKQLLANLLQSPVSGPNFGKTSANKPLQSAGTLVLDGHELPAPPSLDGLERHEHLKALDFLQVRLFGVLRFKVKQIISLDALQVRALSVVIEEALQVVRHFLGLLGLFRLFLLLEGLRQHVQGFLCLDMRLRLLK